MVFRDVSNKHYLRSFFVFGLLEVLLCSGITYGWASIVYVFKVEYFYYGSLCHEASTSLKNNTNRSSTLASEIVGEDGLPGYLAQDKIFNLIFTVAVFFFTSVQFPTGLFLDKFGPRVARMFGGWVDTIFIWYPNSGFLICMSRLRHFSYRKHPRNRNSTPVYN